MDEARGQKLLPLLTERLDTLEAAGDIAATVHQIRDILGQKAFSSRMTRMAPPADEAVTLDRPHAMRLRSLALMLTRRVTHPDPVLDAARAAVAAWILGGPAASVEQVLLCLLVLNDQQHDRPAEPESIASLHSVMAEIRRGMGPLTQR